MNTPIAAFKALGFTQVDKTTMTKLDEVTVTSDFASFRSTCRIVCLDLDGEVVSSRCTVIHEALIELS